MRIEHVELEPTRMAGLREVVALTDLSAFFGRAFTMVAAQLARWGVEPAGPATSLYHPVTADKAEVTAGYPIGGAVTPTPDVVEVTLPGGHAVQTIHVGRYDELPRTYAELTRWISAHDLTPTAEMWEQYLVGPDGDPDPGNWRTRVVYPLRDTPSAHTDAREIVQ